MTDCISSHNHSAIKVKELGRQAAFRNPDRKIFLVGRIDGCLVQDGIRADFLVSVDEFATIVELKGCNLDHACDQLFAAAGHPAVKPYIDRKKLGFLIVCSRFPRHSTSVQLAKVKASRIFNAGLKVACNKYECGIDQMGMH